MAKQIDVSIESALPVVMANGLNTTRAIDFSGSPQMIGSPVDLFLDTTAALGTAQNSTPTAAQLIGGIVTQTSATGAGTVTLPTGTQLSAALTGTAVGYSFDGIFANLGGTYNLTITGATGSTVIGNAVVPSGKNAYMTFTNTGANTWNVYVVVSA